MENIVIMKIMKIMKIIYGIIFLAAGLITILNGLYLLIFHKTFTWFLPADVGYSIIILSIGIISIAFIRSNDVIKLASSLFMATVLSTGLFILRVLTILSHWIDSYILLLEGERVSFNLFTEINYLEIYIAPLTIALLIYSFYILRKRTI